MDAAEIIVIDWTEFETESQPQLKLNPDHKLSSNSIIDKFLNAVKDGDEEQSRVFSSERSDNSTWNSTDEESEFDADAGTASSRVVNRTMENLMQAFVVSDAAVEDFPVVFASSGFYELTGYAPEEIIGKNCRFLQGPETDRKEVEKIREAVGSAKSYCGRILNYRKDGTSFWNLLTLTPIKDESGKAIKYIGMHVDVSKHTEGVHEKDVRPNGLSSSLIHYDARHRDKAMESFTEVVLSVKHSKSHGQTKGVNGIGKYEELDELNHLHRSVPSFLEDSTVRERIYCSGVEGSFTETLPNPEAFSACNKISCDSLAGEKPLSSMVGKPSRLSEVLVATNMKHNKSQKLSERRREIRQGIDLATSLERIEKNFVITDPRLPDNPIIFVSDSFLELTEYSREEVLGKNCRFLQGPETDKETVSKIRDAIAEEKEITVQLINYTKSGKRFLNLFHLQPMRDQKGELQYLIGVQLDGTGLLDPLQNRLSGRNEKSSTQAVKLTAENVDQAVREFPDANMRPDELWAIYSRPVSPRPHKKNCSSWLAIQKITASGENIGLHHFKHIRPLGSGDTGSVYLVELQNTGELYAMKAMEKSEMMNCNKVFRACIERDIVSRLDHPFLPTLYSSFQTPTHVCLITDFFPGGELFALLDKQPMKVFKEESARFYAAEVVIGLEYLHCLGVIYRDLKPENVLLQKDGHVILSDFDLSFLATCETQVIKQQPPKTKSKRKAKRQLPVPPTVVVKPITRSNSFVGTEEYVAPEIITGAGHGGAVDWWALGILLYEMLYGRTPFRGKNRETTFSNILNKELTFPTSISVSPLAKQLIQALLNRNPASRLGSNNGASEIKQHPFFHGLKWQLIRCMKPPPLEIPLEFTTNDQKAKHLQVEDKEVYVYYEDQF
ncbi:unnamed protein product [Rhodiola kirilowii]